MYLIETWSFQEDIKDFNDIMNIIDYNNNNNNDSNVWVFIRTSTNVVISLQSTVVVDVVLRCACVATPTGPSVRSAMMTTDVDTPYVHLVLGLTGI